MIVVFLFEGNATVGQCVRSSCSGATIGPLAVDRPWLAESYVGNIAYVAMLICAMEGFKTYTKYENGDVCIQYRVSNKFMAHNYLLGESRGPERPCCSARWLRGRSGSRQCNHPIDARSSVIENSIRCNSTDFETPFCESVAPTGDVLT